MEKYRFNVYVRDCQPHYLQTSDHIMRKLYLEDDFFNDYTLRYNIPERTISTKVVHCDALFRRIPGAKPFFKEMKVKWYETIYNVKVEKVRKSSYKRFKVSFSVRCTPKEAWIIGNALESIYYNVTYKAKE